MRAFALIALLHLSLASPSVFADINGVFQPLQQSSDAPLQTIAQQSFVLFQTAANEQLTISPDVKVIFGYADGPLYDPANHQIHIPYAFIAEAKARFEAADYAESGISAAQASQDALLHTLFHELAHALINIYELPIVGKEEDAADSLATFLLIELFDQGQEIALSAADLFDLESYDRQTLESEDFWGEHSLDEQRFYATLCHVYGSNPEHYQALIDDELLSEDHHERCIEEYALLQSSWIKLLQPYLKQ